MEDRITHPWILAGYDLFAKEGPSGLKVEVLARRVGKSKSSFYHHFADLDVFTERLLHYHRERAALIATREQACQNVVPDLLLLLLEVKPDLLFNRQLRIHRNVAAFRQCVAETGRTVSTAILPIWADMLGLANNPTLANSVLQSSLESFYGQLTEETLHYDWLVNYVNELRTMVLALRKSESRPTLYGSV